MDLEAETEDLIDLRHAPEVALGGLRLFPSRLEAAWDGGREMVQPRVMQALICLARAKGAVVSRDDLIRCCWGGRILSDDAVNRCIAKVRQLASAGGSPRFEIETIPRIGYRLIPTVPGNGADPPPATPYQAGPERALAPAQKGADPAGVAILPFANLSGDPAQAYFCEGVSQEFRAALSRAPDLRVIGRTSCERFRDADAIAAAEALGVASVVTGSVRRSATTVRISAELVSGADGRELWSETFDRAPGEALADEAAIGVRLAQAILPRLAPGRAAAIAPPRLVDPPARDLLQRAVALWRTQDEAALREALALTEAAVQVCGTFAGAFARQAVILAKLAEDTPDRDEEDRLLARALAAARRAVELEPGSGLAHAALAEVHVRRLEFPEAVAESGRAAELDPADPDVLTDHAEVLLAFGLSGEALAVINRAEAIDPLSAEPLTVKARCLLALGRVGEAQLAARAAVGASPASPEAQLVLGDALLLAGEVDGAREAYGAIATDWRRLASLALLEARAGERGEADRALAALTASFPTGVGHALAQVHAQRGEGGLAFEALDRAVADRDPGLHGLASDYWLYPLHGYSRYRALTHRLGLG